jgi:ABC-type phosphate transport system substrate-binding protein
MKMFAGFGRTIALACIAAASAPALVGSAWAESVAIIVNASNPTNSMSTVEVKKLYENDVVKWSDGKAVVLYDLPVKSETRKKVSTAVLGKEAEEVARAWANRKITNTAKNPPIVVNSAVLVQSRVAEDPGAIGYLPKSEVIPGKVKVIAVID